MKSPTSQTAPKVTNTVASDEAVADTAELVRNGELIEWDGYWLSRQDITPQQAAKLAHSIDPIRWPEDQFKQGQIPNDLRIKIQRLAEWLAERNQSWTLAELVKVFGNDAAPYGMKQAVWIESARLATEQQIDDMRDSGRYTLEGADTMLVRFAGTTPGKMLESLLRTVKDDAGKRAKEKELPLHSLRSPERLESHTIRTFLEVATSENLNRWLRENHPEINWRFPEPTSQIIGVGETASGVTPWQKKITATKPATQEQIIEAFPITGGWGDKLQKAPSGKYKWLDGTWVHMGSRRPGDATTYNPVKIALAISASKEQRMTLAACDNAIKKYFPEWWGEWEAASELLRRI